MRYGLQYATSGAPAVEPISSAAAKLHLRVDISTDDTLIAALITAARQKCELYTRRQLITATWQMTLDAFPDEEVIYVPRPPLQSVTSITYVDENGVVQTWTAALYRVDIATEPGRITPAYGESWPSTRDVSAAVTVKYKAGYGDASTAVPSRFIAGMQLFLAVLYEHRDEVIVDIPEAVRNLWADPVWDENQ